MIVTVLVEEGLPAVANPEATPIVARPTLDELHVAREVIGSNVPLRSLAVALNSCVVFAMIVGFKGKTVIKSTSLTRREEDPLIEPTVAVRVVVPTALLSATPLLIVATSTREDDQLAEAVKFCVVCSKLSLNVPVAVKGVVVPVPIVRLAGVTAMLLNVGGPVTVNVVAPIKVPNVARTCVVPSAFAVTTPVGVVVATVDTDDFQVTLLVMSSVLLLLKIPVATKGFVVFTRMKGLFGVTDIDTKVGTDGRPSGGGSSLPGGQPESAKARIAMATKTILFRR